MAAGEDGSNGAATRVFDSSIQVPDQQYTKRRRHQSINDARDRVPSTILDIEKLLMERQIHPENGLRALQRTVETLAMEIFWMLQQHPEGEEYLFQRDLGRMRLSPPASDEWTVVGGEFVGTMPETPYEFPVVEFRGLRSLLTGEDKITGQFVVERERQTRSNETQTVTVDAYTPRHVVKEAYLACVEFLGKSDFGIEFSEDRPLVKITPDPEAETPAGIKSMAQGDLYAENEKLTVTGDNDHLIVVSASSRTPVSGTGKTTLATTIAKALDSSDGGFDADEKAAFDIDKFGYEVISTVEDGSAVIYDEAQGTQSGTGLNALRSQKTEAIDTINGLLNNRDKHLTAIVIVQDMKMLNTSLYGSVDNWILIRKGVEERHGPLATVHGLYKNDYDWGNPQSKTPALEDVTWDPLPDDDPDYSVMERKKQESKTKSTGDGDDDDDEIESLADLPKYHRDKFIRMAADPDVGQKELADEFGLEQASISRIISGEQ